MLVYRVENVILGSNIVYDNWQDALTEIESFFLYGESGYDQKKIILTTEELTKEAFESLPEFEGY